MRTELGAVLAAAALLSGPAARGQDAPQQTVEGAHRFLALFSDQQLIKLNPVRGVWPRFGVEYKASFTKKSDCETTVGGALRAYYTPNQGWVMVGTPQFEQRRFESLGTRNGVPLPYLPVTIDWSRVSSVSIVDSIIDDGTSPFPGMVVSLQTPTWQARFTMPDAPSAQRLEYAMEFLKAACDQTAETGF